MSIPVLAAIAAAALWLGAGFLLLGLDWWRPSNFDIFGYLAGGVLIFLPAVIALAQRQQPPRGRRD